MTKKHNSCSIILTRFPQGQFGLATTPIPTSGHIILNELPAVTANVSGEQPSNRNEYIICIGAKISLFIPNLITGVKLVPGLFAAILAVTPFSEVVTPSVLAIGETCSVKINWIPKTPGLQAVIIITMMDGTGFRIKQSYTRNIGNLQKCSY